MRDRENSSRAGESKDQRRQRLQVKRIQANTSRATESEDQREHHLQTKRIQANTSRAIESEDQREHRLQKMRKQASTSRATESEDKREQRLQTKRIETSTSRASERHSNLCLEGFHYDPRKDYSKHINAVIGGMNQISKYCFALKYKCEPLVGSLLPLPSENSKFSQTYFNGDEEREVNQRCDNILGLRRDIVLNLQRMFYENNQLIKTFKAALEDMPSYECKVIIRADRRPVGEHERRFNNPQINEVAIIIARSDCDRRDIVIQIRGGSLQGIAETNRSYDALQYPIIFWQGEDGYNFDADRRLYIRLNQNKLQSEEYIHLKDAVATEKNVDDIGLMVILPSTFTGSPRQMHEYTQDAMTHVRSSGRPDLFITFTSNPASPEIKEELTHGQTSTDRHDLLARVFRQKQQKLINVLTKMDVFGETRCWMYSIEWQKRRLPHSYYLIWLKEKIHSKN
ncbi:hypothetical protein AVEN_77807-1 [Araneus ventricosus]|uniref:Helitron helicase-like domain-containing protein n=1 Tax=Araneus ventricosus TaxID=182803 RepID=A0A4Y2GRW4_ARAVE|nr:hypothetical protein AVEN_77807-1 [Araneus ventricosus]